MGFNRKDSIFFHVLLLIKSTNFALCCEGLSCLAQIGLISKYDADIASCLRTQLDEGVTLVVKYTYFTFLLKYYIIIYLFC